MDSADSLDLFLPPVRQWFRAALGQPTPAQRQGWPAIAAGQNTLILAPTGSGKTLAAFLACLDQLWRQEQPPRGVQLLYISPLKALNNDIYRNLQVPLEGVRQTARNMGQALPEIEVAVRTGDTPAAERQRLVRRPPHVLITTPESLHLLLTSRARNTLRNVTHCIVDEIHALCSNKRGVFLALLLERLAVLNPSAFVRIGLSATQRPLEEVARYLGGLENRSEAHGWQPVGLRPVTVIDAGLRKDLDLRVISPVDHFGSLAEKSVWPSIYRLLDREIRQHRSTIVFANNRRTVERITSRLNEECQNGDQGMGNGERGMRNENNASCPFPVPHSPFPIMARAHHGSVALDVRQQTEEALKEGRLPAVVATASLELGIDMGAVDLVCQVESPGSVARGLQRVGRAGHLVGQKSKGRLIPKMPADLVEQAVLAREMVAGRVEEIRVPINSLDVLAQQIVAAVAMDAWEVPALYGLFRRAYPFRDLTPAAFESVLDMVSGRFQTGNGERGTGNESAFPHSPLPIPHFLQARISWDRVHNRLHPLPGSQQLALLNGGAIPDTGQYPAYAASGVRIGELDEEFIYERRIGDAFLLGTNAWRIERIETDRVLVSPAEGVPAMVPFWRGENAGRSYDLGRAMGRFLHELAGRIDSPDCLAWLEQEYYLDTAAAKNVRHYLRRQLAAGPLPTDQTLVIEASRDQLGDWQVILLSPLGGRLHLTLRLAIENVLARRLGYRPQCLHHNDGILIRLADMVEPVLDLFDGLTPENVESLILEELADSALFALRFRQNAARALLMPRGKPGKRAPLWLQRLRGREMLQVARQHPDFPIVAETFRECLHDHLDVSRVQELLRAIQAGTVRIHARRTEAPSPFAAGLLFAFTAANMYEFDRVDPGSNPSASLDRTLLDQLVAGKRDEVLLDPRAIHQVERRLRHLGQPPRSAAETAEWLRRLGDVSASQLEGRAATFLQELEADGRACRIELPGVREPQRWVLTENAEPYRHAFGQNREPGTGNGEQTRAAAEAILFRFLATHALVGLNDVLERYPFERTWVRRKLEEWTSGGRLVSIAEQTTQTPALPSGGSRPRLADERFSLPENLGQVQRGTLALLRREVVTAPAPQFVDFLLHWQGLCPATRPESIDALTDNLDRLEGLPLPADIWEQAVLPARMPNYQPRWLDEAIAGGEWSWVCERSGDSDLLAFWRREHLSHLPSPVWPDALNGDAELLVDQLRRRGAFFVADLAAETSLPPSAVRSALWNLARRGLVTNDRMQRGMGNAERGMNADVSPPNRRSVLRTPRSPFPVPRLPEGRWSLLPWGHPEAEAHAVFLASVLLRRYGIVARELALLDPWMLPWRVLYEVLSRMEWTGEVRRGYFVEGLSGAQFALPEAVQMLQDVALPSAAGAPVLLLHTLDPANLYGSGAPFDIPLLDGGTRPLLRRPGNWLLVRAGRPILIVEQLAKRLTALPSGSPADLAAAVARLPDILAAARNSSSRHRLSVAEWNGQPVTATDGRELLEAAGFVRDYQEMTLYGGCR